MTHPCALELSLRLDRAPLPPDARLHVHLVARIKALEWEDSRRRPPLSVVFAVDTSGSMTGPPLAQVARSIDKLSSLLQPEDRAGVVVFADEASELFPLLASTPEAQRTLRSRVDRLRAGGNTNIEAGLRLALSMMPERGLGERQVVLLLSDGAPNVGRTAASDLAAVVRAFRPNVSVSTLGYGPCHHEDVLTAIQEAGGGRYHFIRDPGVCSFELAQALGAQGDVVAEAVRIELQPRDGVEILRFLGHAVPTFGASGLSLALPDLTEGTEHLVVAELALQTPAQCGPWELAGAAVHFQPVGAEEKCCVRASLSAEVMQRPATIVPGAYAQVLLLRCDEVRAEARALADRKQHDGAAALLRRMIRAIEAAPGYAPADGSPLAEACEQLVDDAVGLERRPAPEQYAAWRRTMVTGLFASSTSHSVAPQGMRSPTSRRVTGAVTGLFPVAHLRVVTGPVTGLRFKLEAAQVIGRTPTADIPLLVANVSRRHAQVLAQYGKYFLVDLGSSNGTWLNGVQVLGSSRELANGDLIRVGEVEMRFEQGSPTPATGC